MSGTARDVPVDAARPTSVLWIPTCVRRSASTSSSLVPYAVRTWNAFASSSNSKIDPPSVADSSTACLTIADSTMSRSRLELPAGERVDFAPPERDHTDYLVLAQHRHSDDRAEAAEPLPKTLLLGVVLGIR